MIKDSKVRLDLENWYSLNLSQENNYMLSSIAIHPKVFINFPAMKIHFQDLLKTIAYNTDVIQS